MKILESEDGFYFKRGGGFGAIMLVFIFTGFGLLIGGGGRYALKAGKGSWLFASIGAVVAFISSLIFVCRWPISFLRYSKERNSIEIGKIKGKKEIIEETILVDKIECFIGDERGWGSGADSTVYAQFKKDFGGEKKDLMEFTQETKSTVKNIIQCLDRCALSTNIHNL